MKVYQRLIRPSRMYASKVPSIGTLPIITDLPILPCSQASRFHAASDGKLAWEHIQPDSYGFAVLETRVQYKGQAGDCF